MTDSAQPLPELVAAVDLGSNSFHLLVARTDGGEPVVVDRLREMVRLAGGLGRRKRLSPESQQRALDCLLRFGQRLRHMPPDSVHAVGTNTLRSAQNAGEFLEQAERALGHSIEVVSGIEEARLVYLGVSQSLPAPEVRRLVVDIGGGSTELIVGQRFEPELMQSLYVGCVSMSREFFRKGEIQEKSWQRAELAVLRELESHKAAFREAGWQEAVGSSGTVRAIQAVVRGQGWGEEAITLASLERLRDALIEAGSIKKVGLAGLSAERRPVFPGGVTILLAAFKALRIQSMRPAEGALREGLLHDLLGRIREEDIRDRSVEALAERCHVDLPQAQRVERTALECLAQVAEAWRLGGQETRRRIAWAARLHEIGLDIAHSQHHRHGEYIIAHSDLHGFSRQGQRLLATLVRAHRRKFPVELFRELPGKRGRAAERLAVLLRLAALLHRSRSPDLLPVFSLRPGRHALELRFPEGWLDANPLTRADLEHESAYLAKAGFELTFL